MTPIVFAAWLMTIFCIAVLALMILNRPGLYRWIPVTLLSLGAAALSFALALEQGAGSTQAPAAPTNIVSGEHWPCMDGSSGDCLTHEERVDRAQRIAKGLKEASSTITLRDLICANAPTMVICVEAAPEPTQAAPVPLDEYYEQCVAKCEENVPN